MVTITLVTKADVDDLYAILMQMQAGREAFYFERCLSEQELGHRYIFIARLQDGTPAGYVMLNRKPQYPSFRHMNIPEIQDLSVAPNHRRQGIGAQMIDVCEQQAKQDGADMIGIGVGMPASFGAAQRLYVSKGYMPDGAGVCYDNDRVTEGEMRPVDELLCLKLIKTLTAIE